MTTARLSKTSLATLGLLVALTSASCGGGGSDTAAVPPSPIPPPPAAVEPEPVTSVPPAVYADVNRKAAFDRMNEVRRQAGLGVLAQNLLLDQAAQAHSKYQALDGDTGHVEVAGKSGFTGERPSDRVRAAGYVHADLAEAAAAIELPHTGAHAVDLLMGLPYHRMGLLLYHPVELGIGFHALPNQLQFLTVLLGRQSGSWQGAPAMDLVVWPPAGATNVPYSMWMEEPDPIPENNGARAGHAASVQVNNEFREIHVENFEIRDGAQAIVPTKLLTSSTDAFLARIPGGRAFAAALPRQPLAKNTQYTATFSGYSILLSTGMRTPIARTWSFTTGNKPDF